VTARTIQDVLGWGILNGPMLWAAAFLGIAIVTIGSRLSPWPCGWLASVNCIPSRRPAAPDGNWATGAERTKRCH